MSVGWRGAAGGGGGYGGGGGGRSAWSSSSWTSWAAWTWAAIWSTQWQPSEGRLWTQSNEAMPEYVSLENYALGLMIVFALGAVVGAIGPVHVMQSLCGLWSCAPANADLAKIEKNEGESSDDFQALLADEPEADPPDEKTAVDIMQEVGPAGPASVPDELGGDESVDVPGENPAAVPGPYEPPPIEGVVVPAVPSGDNENEPKPSFTKRINHQQPTDKQFKYLKDLIEQTGEEVPEYVWRWKTAMSEWIDKLSKVRDEQRRQVQVAIDLDRAKSGNFSGGAHSSAPEPACGPVGEFAPDDGMCNGISSGGETDDPDHLGHRALLIIALMSELSRTLLFEVPSVKKSAVKCEEKEKPKK